jgi:hypothetical protein
MKKYILIITTPFLLVFCNKKDSEQKIEIDIEKQIIDNKVKEQSNNNSIIEETKKLKTLEGEFEVENYNYYLNLVSKNDVKNRLTERNNFDYDRAVIISSIVFKSDNKCEVCKFYYKKKRGDRKIYHTYDYEVEDNLIKIFADVDTWTIEINNEFKEFTLNSKKYYKK